MAITATTARFKITAPEDIAPAARALAELASEIGPFKVAACESIASRASMMDADGNILARDYWGWNGPGEQWWMNTRLALTSPMPRACRYESEAFWCNADGFYTVQPNEHLDKIDLSDFEKRACCKAAIVVPVHLPLGQIGVLSLTPTDDRTDLSAEFEAHAEMLTIITQRFISGYVKVRQETAWVPSNCQLTKREVECLRWAAIGKTDREIGMILGRSHATIRFHFKNAGEKLNTVNRSQTVFKAGQLGYIGT